MNGSITTSLPRSALTKHTWSRDGFLFCVVVQLEDQLDAVSRGEQDWLAVLRGFWAPFSASVQRVEAGESHTTTASNKRKATARALGDHPDHGGPVTVREGPYGAYVSVMDPSGSIVNARLPGGSSFDSITLAAALQSLQLPRVLGNSNRERIFCHDGIN